jgi:hypothetical protein
MEVWVAAMNKLRYVFLLILSGCASLGVPRHEVASNENSTSVSTISFTEFLRSADASAEQGALSPYLKQGRLVGDGFAVSKAKFMAPKLSEYYFDDHICVTRSLLTAQLNEIGYAEIKDNLPSSERSFDSYAIYTKSRARINVDFTSVDRNRCVVALFIKYQ